MNIFLWGQRNIYGGGIHFANFCDSLKKVSLIKDMVIEVDIRGQDLELIASNSSNNDVHIFFFPLDVNLNIKGKVIKWGIFEANLLTDEYIDYLIKCHLVWVPSKWAKKVLIDHGLEKNKVDVVPEGVNPTIFHPFNYNFFEQDEIFRFYMIGKNENRKGIKELLEGFKLAYGNDPNVKLFLKADNFWSDRNKNTDKNKELLSLINDHNLNNVTLLTGKLKLSEISMIHACCNVFIFPTRAEGWGLPLIEAIAAGSPVITNFYSGQTEYLQHITDQIKMLDFNVCSINQDELFSNVKLGAEWVVSSIDSIASSMIFMKNNFSNFKIKSLLASEFVRKNFSWNNAADEAYKSLFKNEFLNIKVGKPF
jgi:glycosyltransferase involved in cell wall biosynthesis